MNRWLRGTIVTLTLNAVVVGHAAAQNPQNGSGLVDAVLDLNRSAVSNNQQLIRDQLFSGRIEATIIDADRDNTNFEDGDIIAFALGSVSRGGGSLVFSGNRPAFDAWVGQNSERILEILFPASLTESLTGVDVAQSHAQEFLVSTALAAGGRGAIGGRVEFESFDVEGGAGNAVQGLFRFNVVAVEGRFAELSNTISTRSTNVVVNAHPGWGSSVSGVEWRVGGDGYLSTLYSTSRATDLGAFDYGGGPWASGWKDFSAVSVSFASMLIGSKTYIPNWWIDDDLATVANVINDRAIRWDFTYGGAVQFPLVSGWTTGIKLVQTASVKSPRDEGRTSQLVLLSLGHLIEGSRAIDFGYRYSGGGDRYRAHGIFMNANFQF